MSCSELIERKAVGDSDLQRACPCAGVRAEALPQFMEVLRTGCTSPDAIASSTPLNLTSIPVRNVI